jgi:tetratricopeptide (TPR) repeat protein
LARAEAFYGLQQSNRGDSSWWNWGETALKDLADAITLSNSSEIEIKSRKLRQKFENFAFSNYTAEQRDEDFEFEKQSPTGIERGKWIYQKVIDWDPYQQAGKGTISLIQEAIECGYDAPEAYLLLAKAYHGSCNYGLALDEIDRLLETINGDHEKAMIVEVLCVRAKISMEMGRYQEADETFLNAKILDAALFSQYLWINLVSFEEDILVRSLIEMKFNVQKPWFWILSSACLPIHMAEKYST